MKIFILLFLAILADIVSSADSDGKEFVFNFMQSYFYNSSVSTTNVIVIPSFKDSVCTFKYTQQSDNQVVTFKKIALFGKTNEIYFDPNEVLLLTEYVWKELNVTYITDFRVFVSCTEEIKLIGRFSDPLNGYGDLFEIHSITNAGNKYVFTTPSSNNEGWISILPISQESSITLSIEEYINKELYSNLTLKYDTTLGQNQLYLSFFPNKTFEFHYNNASIVISSTSNFFIMFMSPWISTSNIEDASCGITCNDDYVTFMPMPVVSKDCNSNLSQPDQRLITNTFTTRLYVSPPSVGNDCNDTFTLDVYNGDNANKQLISPIGFNAIELADKSDIGSTTSQGPMSMYRLGSVHSGQDNITSYGQFAHYLPSIQEWVTGKTQFFTLAKNCSIELYSHQVNSNFMKLDGIILSKIKYTLNYLHYFKKVFGHFVIPVDGYGLHTFETSGKYVFYVICQNVNGAYNGAGYVAAFNRRISQ